MAQINPRVIFRYLKNGTTIVYNSENATYFCISESGTAQWKSLVTSFSTSQIKNDFVEEMTNLGLVHTNVPRTQAVVKATQHNWSSQEPFYDFVNLHNGAYTPTSVLWEITYNCNLNCIHCYEDCADTRSQVELKTSEIQSIIDQLYETNVFFLTITGGEPFARNDIFEILEYATRKNFLVDVMTNGTLLTTDKVLQLKRLNIHKIHVTIFSLDTNVHDRITRTKGSLEKTLETINLLKIHGIGVVIKYSLMKENSSSFERVKEYAREHKFELMIDPLITPRDNGDCTPMDLMLDSESIEKIVADGEFLQFLKTYLKAPKEDIHNTAACNIFFRGAAISSDGTVYPCNQLKIEIGKLPTQTFGQVWNESDELQKLRALRRTDVHRDELYCRSCSDYEFCLRCPGIPYLEHGDINSISDIDCQLAALYKKYTVFKKQ